MAATTRTVGPSVTPVALAILLSCAGASLAAEKNAPSQVTTSEQQVNPILAALDAGDGRQALELLRSRSLELSSDERSLLEARAYLLLNDLPEARRRLTTLTRDRSNDATALYWLGRVYEADGAAALAASQYGRASRNGPATADLHYHWATALKASGQLLGDVVRRQAPEGTEVPKVGEFSFDGLVVGQVRSKPRWVLVSPPESAVHQAYQALALEPENGGALLLAAEIWSSLQRHEEATAMFAKAAEHLTNKGDLARCHDGWAADLLALGDLDGYLKHTTERMRVTGESNSAELARCYAQAAEALARRGDLQGQIRYLTFSVELVPDVDRLVDLADALRAAQRLDEAQEQLKRAMDRKPSLTQQRAINRRLLETEYLTSPRPGQ
jgi:tetratricopeptide (TPR) repeat protein